MPLLKISPRHKRRRSRAFRRPHGLSARLLKGAAVLLGVLSILHVYPAFAQEKSLLWERFDVDIIIRKDSSFEVTEHQTIRFTRGTFTYGYREIPTRYIDSIDNWTLTDGSGNRYRLANSGKEPYTFTVADKGPRYVVYWYFPPTFNRSEIFTLAYTVRGRPALL